MTRRGGAIVGAAMVALVVFALAVFLLPFAFPTPPPIITRFTGTQLFSPNSDGARERAMFSIRVRTPGTLTLTVADESGTVVKTLASQTPTKKGWLRIPWRGLGDDGQTVADGQYAVRLRAEAPGGKVFSSSRRVRVDTVPPGIASLAVVSALGHSEVEGGACRAAVVLDTEGSVEMDAVRPMQPGARPLRRFGPRPAAPGEPVHWHWNGVSAGSPVPAGLYAIRAVARDQARNAATETRTCWVGHITGRATHTRPGGLTRVTLHSADGQPVAASTPVRLRLFRKIGTPGSDQTVLGPRIARAVVTQAGKAAIRIPPGISPADLWLVATTANGAALIRVTT